MVLEEGKKRRFLEQRDLDRLRDAGTPVALVERGEEGEVVEDRVGRREGAEEVLLAERVDAVFDAHAGVVLGKHRRGDADEANATVRRGRGVADHVEQGVAADGEDVRMAVDAVGVDGAVDGSHLGGVVLDRLATRDDRGRRDERDAGARDAEVGIDRLEQPDVRRDDAIVDHAERFGRLAGGIAGQHVAQERVVRREQTAREVHRIVERHLHALPDGQHHASLNPSVGALNWRGRPASVAWKLTCCDSADVSCGTERCISARAKRGLDQPRVLAAFGKTPPTCHNPKSTVRVSRDTR